MCVTGIEKNNKFKMETTEHMVGTKQMSVSS